MVANLTLTYGSLNLTATPFLVEYGLDTGAPQNVTEALAFLLQDGEVELTDRTSNRTIVFTVLVEGANLTALATAEALLMAEADKPLNTLKVDPGDSAPATVFDTFKAQVVLLRDDDYEASGYRAYQVTLRAAPFGKSSAPVTVAALPASGTTTTLVDAGSATTGWTGTSNGGSITPAVVSGAVGITTSAVTGTTLLALSRTGAITTSTTKYLVVDWRPTTGAYVLTNRTLTAYGDGTKLAQIGNTYPLSGGTTMRSTFYVLGASVTTLRLEHSVSSASDPITSQTATPQARTLHIDNINRTDVRPSIGTTRQMARSVDVSGSEPTPGSLTLSHASSALGDALGYVWNDPTGVGAAYVPALSPYATVAVTADTTLVSGGKFVITSTTAIPQVYDVPAVGLPPGSYLLMMRAASVTGSVSATIAWSAQTRINSTNVDTAQSGTLPAAFTTAYAIYPMTRLSLPGTTVRDPSAATIRVSIGNNSTPSVSLDEVWLFNTTLGVLIWVDCGTGTAASGGPSRRLIIDAPTVDRPRPQVLRGHATDGSDAFAGSVKAWGFPEFRPTQTNIFTVTTNATDADATFTSWPRWHTNAAS